MKGIYWIVALFTGWASQALDFFQFNVPLETAVADGLTWFALWFFLAIPFWVYPALKEAAEEKSQG